MTVVTNLISATSRVFFQSLSSPNMSLRPFSLGGEVQITSSDPFVHPSINPNFLATEFDIFTMIEAVKAAKRFVSGEAWKGYVLEPFGDFATANTDEEIEKYVRDSASTVFHVTGTASMSPQGAQWGVVDPDLKVKGVEGLRIVDGSVIVSLIFSLRSRHLSQAFANSQPFIPSAHTQGPIYLFGERAADIIKSEYKALTSTAA
jgi:choline dehydrogenase-like flavoprotein